MPHAGVQRAALILKQVVFVGPEYQANPGVETHEILAFKGIWVVNSAEVDA